MDIFLITEQQAVLVTAPPQQLPAGAFLWLDATHDEVTADPQAWRKNVERLTGTFLYDLHLQDVVNMSHPSYFDSTQHYEMIIFRKLALPAGNDNDSAGNAPGERNKIPSALSKLATQPVTFLLMDQVLVTVRAAQSRTIEAARKRLLDYAERAEGMSHAGRPPLSPTELALRLLNAMVDQYLQLRQPLTAQLDRWQRALLDPRRPFKDWLALLEARIQLRKLDHLCEEQHDALQELRDHMVDMHNFGRDSRETSRSKDLLLVRINDVMEHVNRVLNHARRLETALESAVQIHFSALAHRTSEIMRTLTVITALFMPLTLITGIFGMNFEILPLLKNRQGFWIVMGLMVVIVIGLLIFFRRKRFIEDRDLDGSR